MNDYQMPLFDRYDISVEFDRHLSGLGTALDASSADIVRLDDATLAEKFSGSCEVCQIELWSGDASLHQPNPGNTRFFELHVPYRGDDELWHLYPSHVVTGVYGEVFRGQLILTGFGDTEAAVHCSFQRRLAEIEIIIAQQAERIRLFEETLPSVIQVEALKLRGRALSKFTGLQH